MTSPRAGRALAATAIAIGAAIALMLPAVGESSRGTVAVACRGGAAFKDSYGTVGAYGRLNLFPNKSVTKARIRFRVRLPRYATWSTVKVLTIGPWDAHSQCVAFTFGPSRVPLEDDATVSWSVKHRAVTVHLRATPTSLQVTS